MVMKTFLPSNGSPRLDAEGSDEVETEFAKDS
jgi:hypothetical protein